MSQPPDPTGTPGAPSGDVPIGVLGLLQSDRRIALIMISTTLVMSGQGVISPVLPLFAQAFGAATTTIGLTLSIFALARLLLNVPLGVFSDRYGRRALLIGGPIVTGLGMLGSGLAPNVWWLLGWRFVAGAGSAMYMTAAQVYLADISTPATRARVIGANHAALLFGVSIGPGLGGGLAELFDLRVPFLVVGVGGLVAGLFGWWALPETRPARMPGSEPARARDLLRSLDFGAVSAVTLCVFFSRAGGRFTLMPLLAAGAFGYGAGAIGALFTAMAVLNLVGVVPGAALADRLGRKVAIVPSLVVIAAAFVWMASTASSEGFLLASLLLATGTAIIGPAPAAYAADIAPAQLRGLAMGVYRSAGDVGFVLGPVLLGAIADFASIAWALLVNAGLVAGAALAFGLIATERPATTSA